MLEGGVVLAAFKPFRANPFLPRLFIGPQRWNTECSLKSCKWFHIMYGAFFFTVALTVTTAYFLMGGLPLLILKHDVPLDARFIRGFFDVYYRASFWTSLGASVSYAVWGRYYFAVGAAVFACITTLLRLRLVQAMEGIGNRIGVGESTAIRNFRRVHSAALIINFIQLVVIVWGILRLSQELTPR